MALMNVKDYKKNCGLKNMSDAIRHILKTQMRWTGGNYALNSPSGRVGTNGIDFWKEPEDKSWKARKKRSTFMMPVNKAQKIELDTDAKLLIFDDLVAIDIS